MNKTITLQEFLRQNVLLMDGAMGTYYNERFPQGDQIVERENLLHPDQVQSIHYEYLKAGAVLLRTNSFAANSNFFPDKTERIETVRASYRLAQQAVQQYQEAFPDAVRYVAADLGTVFDAEIIGSERVFQEYQENVDAFLEEGADVFLFETQADTALLQELSVYIKKRCPQAFVMCTFSLDKTGYTKAGISLERLMRQLYHMKEMDAYGLNCGMDAVHMLSHFQELKVYDDRPFLALPNAGYPYILRGRPIYAKNETYFVENMKKMVESGVDVVGGCCGTTPQHIAALQQALKTVQKGRRSVAIYVEHPEKRTLSDFWKKLQQGQKPFVVELDPPFDTNIDKVMHGAEVLKEHGVDLLTLSDSPMGRTRMDALQLAGKVQHEVGIQVMPHVTCRDRNMIALRAGMLGSYMNDLRHYLIVTGDPVPVQDRSTVTAVFDYNSIHFMHLIKEMNEELFQADTVVYGGALNYHGRNADAIARRMQLKMQEGCGYFLTQPIYAKEDVERITYLKEKTGAKICCGIMPLVSYKNAVFIANEMPGIRVPDEVIAKYRPEMTREEAERVAKELAVSMARELKDVADGYYFMTPFNRVNLIGSIIDAIRKEVL